ncbi:Cerebellar degeneration-related protein 2 [Larimichthys crocea]|uniref:Cerebellar degeneration-related protein 2 n=1 Tax=Larimichthys crocea TaxID=215358 RepID=A0A6G0HVH1_LARCR|nr:Cerebellar degeneration-related protein 2 [Larimichthys crocea]
MERSRREVAEQESELTARENRDLEQRLALLDGCQSRQKELEAEVEQLRLSWRADCANSVRRPDQLLLPDTVFFASDETSSTGQDVVEETVEKDEEPEKIQPTEVRVEAVKQRGISLLNEVDAQYSALQVKYDELLRRCQQATDELSHKAVQTSSSPFASSRTLRRLSSSATLSNLTMVLEDGQQPEYKALFNEIFTCIQKTKEDLSENRRPDKDCDSRGSAK